MKKFFLGIVLLSACWFGLMTPSYAEDIDDTSESVTIELSYDTESEVGTRFSIFGLTYEEYDYALKKGYEMSIEQTKNWLKHNGMEKIKEILISHTLTDTFTLQKYNDKKEKMYYVIVQNVPDYLNEKHLKYYTSFPIFLSLDEVESNYLIVETKRVFMIQTPYFFKYSSGINQQPLKNAEFAFYRKNEFDEKEYLLTVDPINWGKRATGKEAWQFISDAKGLVQLPDLDLGIGTYYFEETRAPTGYEISQTSKEILLEIIEIENGLVMLLNGETLYPMQAGELPHNITDLGEPRILNNPTDKPKDPKDPKDPKPPKPPLVDLPKTGEAAWKVSGIGLLIMVITFFYIKRNKERERKNEKENY